MIRVGSWNVETLTGKFFELVDALRRKKVDIASFQETKWKGSHTKEGNQYKLWYSGLATTRHGVGVALALYLKDKVVQVIRISDRFMLLRLVIKDETVNVVSAYALQVGLEEAKKKSFWHSIDDLVRECSTTQQLIIAGDLNDHIGAKADGFSSVHGGFGGDHDTQIDYMLVRRGDLRLCKNCKVFSDVSENQLGFMLGRSTMEAIHIIRSLMEKYRERQKDLHLTFLDLEKAYDNVPRELIWKTLSDKRTPTRYIKVIQDMYEGARTCVRTPTENIEYFSVDAGLHQGLAISLYMFALILDELIRGIQKSILWNKNDQNEEAEIRIGEHILEPKEAFRYLGSVIHKSGRTKNDVTHRIQAGWLGGHSTGNVVRVKVLPLRKAQANRIEVAEIRMLRWTCGKTI
nr:craniofacial development protein 2 [Tanacetum cinerariifolium]